MIIFMAKKTKNVSEAEYRKSQKMLDFLDGVVPSQSFGGNLPLKRNALRMYGYDVLYGKGQELIDLYQCTSVKVTRAFFNTLNTAKR